jgi:hypothetical protein
MVMLTSLLLPVFRGSTLNGTTYRRFWSLATHPNPLGGGCALVSQRVRIPGI